MQKLPEISDRNKGRHMRKEKGTSRQEEEAHSLSGSDQRSYNTLLTGEGATHSALDEALASPFTCTALSVNSMPKYKRLRNGPIKLQTKTLDLDKLPKATNTMLML